MAICDGPWTMTLVNDNGGKGSEVFVFKDITVMGTTFTGGVWNQAMSVRLSDLTGTCEDLATGDPRLTRLTFQFRLPGRTGGAVGMFLAGVGFPPATGNAQFRGRFRAYTPDRFTPSFDKAEAVAIMLDVGDTGTGNGMQALP
jgi:hypothetical protein